VEATQVQEIAVQKLFARLTGQFEDAAALSANGQRAWLKLDVAVRLLRDIRVIIEGAARGLVKIERQLKA
jgi:hypothetical protein